MEAGSSSNTTQKDHSMYINAITSKRKANFFLFTAMLLKCIDSRSGQAGRWLRLIPPPIVYSLPDNAKWLTTPQNILKTSWKMMRKTRRRMKKKEQMVRIKRE